MPAQGCRQSAFAAPQASSSNGSGALPALARARVTRADDSAAEKHPTYVVREYGELLACLILSACLMAIALRAPGLGWTAWVNLLPLFLAIRLLPPLRAGIAGAVWGATLYLGAAVVIGGLVTPSVISLVLLTIVPAAYAYWGAWASHRFGCGPIILALGWIPVEVLLIPVGFSGGVLSGLHAGGAAGCCLSRVFGYVVVAFIIATANALVASVLYEIQIRLPRCAVVLTRSDCAILPLTIIRLAIRHIYHYPSLARSPPALLIVWHLLRLCVEQSGAEHKNNVLFCTA